MDPVIIILVLVVLVGGYILTTFNKFKTTEVRIKASVQEIGNQLKRQAELIPNLVASVKGYFKHEQRALTKITDARKAILGALKTGTAEKLVEAAGKLQAALGGITAVFESTPELQASGPTKQLMDELRDTADKVMYSRRTLIDLTADYNTMLETLPSSWVGSMFKFQAKAGLETPESGEHVTVTLKETQIPKVDL